MGSSPPISFIPIRTPNLGLAEDTLNSAIVHAEISRSYREYLEIFDAFYADDIKGNSETIKERSRGKARVRSLLLSFMAPLHAMAGGVSISIRETAPPNRGPEPTSHEYARKSLATGLSGASENERRSDRASDWISCERHY